MWIKDALVQLDWIIDQIFFVRLYPNVLTNQQQIQIPRPQKPLFEVYTTSLASKTMRDSSI